MKLPLVCENPILHVFCHYKSTILLFMEADRQTTNKDLSEVIKVPSSSEVKTFLVYTFSKPLTKSAYATSLPRAS